MTPRKCNRCHEETEVQDRKVREEPLWTKGEKEPAGEGIPGRGGSSLKPPKWKCYEFLEGGKEMGAGKGGQHLPYPTDDNLKLGICLSQVH